MLTETGVGGGGGGIRTHGTLSRTPVFKTGAFDHSATPPDCLLLERCKRFWNLEKANLCARAFLPISTAVSFQRWPSRLE